MTESLKLPDYSKTLSRMQPGVKEKFYRAMLDGRDDPNTGRKIPGLEDQMLEAITDARTYSEGVDRLSARVEALPVTEAPDPIRETAERELAESVFALQGKLDRVEVLDTEITRLHDALDALNKPAEAKA